MNGFVDELGRALLPISVKGSADAAWTSVQAWIDTGFTGELVIPENVVSALNLAQSGTLNAELGDGSTVTLKTYTCVVDWFGEERTVEVLSNAGRSPLLGIGLLRPHRLGVDYLNNSLSLE